MATFKRTFIFLLTAITITGLFATKLFATSGQWSSSGSTIYYNDGNVGIGTSGTNDPLVINNPSTQVGKVLVGDGVGSWWMVGAQSGGQGMNNIATNGYVSDRWHKRTQGVEGWIISTYNTGSNGGYYKIFHMDTNSETPTTYFSINSLGTTFVKALTVNTTVWGDNVFNKDYNLKPLKQVEAYINENGHLENVPSEEVVIKDGINVADMQKTQMQKIEELTLYAIQQDKKISDLEVRLSKLEGLIVNNYL